MKMQPEAFVRLASVVRPLDSMPRRDRYRAGDFHRAAAVQDLDTRYRWDLFYAAWRLDPAAVNSAIEGLYDSHIDTALKRIVPTL